VMGSSIMLAGVDEVGRGPIAGPVTVCAVVLKKPLPRRFFSGIRNSKAISQSSREEWYTRARALRHKGILDFAVSFSGERFIDRHGISKAVHLSIARSLRRLKISPAHSRILLDGSIHAPIRFKNQETIIRGDELVPIISLASIIAKVRRDRRMHRFAKQYPEYGFDQHKGYGTASHYKAIRRHGVSKLHRRSFLTKVKLKNQSEK